MGSKLAYSLLSLAVVGTVGALAGSAGRTVHAATTNTSSQQTISVIGSSDERVSPNVAQVSAGVMTKASTAAKAQQANDAAMTRLMAVLKAAGIPPADVQTQWYNIQPDYGQPGKPGQQTVVGFQANDNINVTIRHLNQVGSIVDKLVQSGANQINNISYSVTNPASIQQKLYGAALDDARTQAQIIATKLGLTITGVQSVDTTQGGGPIVPMYASQAAATKAVLAPGTQDISTSIMVVYTVSNNG